MPAAFFTVAADGSSPFAALSAACAPAMPPTTAPTAAPNGPSIDPTAAPAAAPPAKPRSDLLSWAFGSDFFFAIPQPLV